MNPKLSLENLTLRRADLCNENYGAEVRILMYGVLACIKCPAKLLTWRLLLLAVTSGIRFGGSTTTDTLYPHTSKYHLGI